MKRFLIASVFILTGCAGADIPMYHERDAGQIFYVAPGNIGYSRAPQMHVTRNQGDVAAYQAEIRAQDKLRRELRQREEESKNASTGLTPLQKCQINWAMDKAGLEKKLYTSSASPYSKEYKELRTKVINHELNLESYLTKCVRKY